MAEMSSIGQQSCAGSTWKSADSNNGTKSKISKYVGLEALQDRQLSASTTIDSGGRPNGLFQTVGPPCCDGPRNPKDGCYIKGLDLTHHALEILSDNPPYLGAQVILEAVSKSIEQGDQHRLFCMI